MILYIFWYTAHFPKHVDIKNIIRFFLIKKKCKEISVSKAFTTVPGTEEANMNLNY